ncbi:MAG: dephospho-CoA kinase, partial [Chloroflexota bacterium]
MKVIGLTGNIGTGKSAIMKVAALRGALTIDADKVVHSIQENNKEIQEKIGKTFGDDALLPNGKINRPALGSIVFSDPAQMEKLEAIIHPQVRDDISEMVKSAKEPLVMIEAIKLLEGPLKDLCDQVWVANCGKMLQLQRLIIARGMDEDEAFKRIMAQSPQADKVSEATSVIDTTGTLSATEAQVNELLDALLDGSATDDADRAKTALLPEITEEEATPEETPAAEAPTVVDTPPVLPEITVRRARPSDIPSIMLLIHKATDGKLQPKRAEILHSLSDRGYLIGQTGSEI